MDPINDKYICLAKFATNKHNNDWSCSSMNLIQLWYIACIFFLIFKYFTKEYYIPSEFDRYYEIYPQIFKQKRYELSVLKGNRNNKTVYK